MPTDFETRLAALLGERKQLRGHLDALVRAQNLVDIKARAAVEAAIAQLVLGPLKLTPRNRPSTGAIVHAVLNLSSSAPECLADPLDVWRRGNPVPGFTTTEWPEPLKSRLALLSLPVIEAVVESWLAALTKAA